MPPTAPIDHDLSNTDFNNDMDNDERVDGDDDSPERGQPGRPQQHLEEEEEGPQLRPSRLLKRAGNLLNTNGQVVKELEDPTPLRPPIKKTSLGKTIRRKLLGGWASKRSKSTGSGKGNFLGRSKSVGGTTGGSVANMARGISRSMTDVSEVAVSRDERRRSALPRLMNTPSEATGVPISPVLEDPAGTTKLSDTKASTHSDVHVPRDLQEGTSMTKVSLKRNKRFVFRLDPDMGHIIWQSKNTRIIPIENIKEIRSGPEMRWCREQFHLPEECAARWITIIYVLENGQYKTLHLLADTVQIFRMWDKSLRELSALVQELMHGLGNEEMRERLWERQWWKMADEIRDHKLVFEEVVRLCRRLSINSSREDLFGWFKQADSKKRDYLDFEDFRRFVKLLKSRSDIDRLYRKMRNTYNSKLNVFDFSVFECFMRREQKSTIPREELRILFEKYATAESSDSTNSILTTESFTSFLLSPHNSPFSDHQRGVWMDMTRPLPEYFISSSHNTYLVGHQLVGESSVEGYVRALLRGCRSVELDIYDGPTLADDPQIFHGKTLTTKVSLRQVCHTIMKYGFVASPYPIIISAEVHLSLQGQERMVKIMVDVFGDRLVRRGLFGDGVGLMNGWEAGEGKELPSPEALKGKILLKAKNLNIPTKSPSLPASTSGASVLGLDMSTSASASDSDAFYALAKGGVMSDDQGKEDKKERRSSDSGVKEQLLRARTNMLNRVKSVGKPPSSYKAPPSAVTTVVDEGTPLSASPLSSNPVLSSDTESYVTPTSTITSTTTAISKPSRPMNSSQSTGPSVAKPSKMSSSLLSLLVYTSGIKFIGLNKAQAQQYLPSYIFSLSESAASKLLKYASYSLIKHARTHLVRVYPKGVKRVGSSNYVPSKYWAGGVQMVAMNWQTVDLGCIINWVMFWRNGGCGWVLKPSVLKGLCAAGGGVAKGKEEMFRRRIWKLNVGVVSGQRLGVAKKWKEREREGKGSSEGAGTSASSLHSEEEEVVMDPYVEITLYVPPWPIPPPPSSSASLTPPSTTSTPTMTTPRVLTTRTSCVMKNGFNPVWEETLSMKFESVGDGDMLDLIFVRFAVRTGGSGGGGGVSNNPSSSSTSTPLSQSPPGMSSIPSTSSGGGGGTTLHMEETDAFPEDSLGVWWCSLGSLEQGYRHLPLFDSQLSQHLFSSIFVKIGLECVGE